MVAPRRKRRRSRRRKNQISRSGCRRRRIKYSNHRPRSFVLSKQFSPKVMGKYLGVIFVRSMTLASYDRKKRERKVLYYPPPLDLDAYRQRQAVCGGHGCGCPDGRHREE